MATSALTKRGIAALAVPLAVVFAAPAQAQQAGADLDALIDASATPEGALATAHRQADAGDLSGAAATLERSLISGGTRDLRLFYVAVLCRLDDRQRAAIELAQVKDGGADPGVRAACGGLEPSHAVDRGRHDGVHGQVSAGMAYDSDASGALAVEFDIPGVTAVREDGFAFTGAAALHGRATVEGTSFIYADLAAQTHDSVSGPAFDYQVGTATLGVGERSGRVEGTIGGVFTHARVNGDPYLTAFGGEVQVSIVTGPDTRLTLHGQVVSEDYPTTLLLSRDGVRYDASLEFQGGRQDSLSYLIGAAYERKQADTNYLAYTGLRGFAAVRLPIGGSGAYGALQGTVRYLDYYDDPLTPNRIETRWFGRAALGVPLGASGLVLEGAGSYTVRDYNAASGLRDYRSVGGEIRLIFKFGK